MTPSSSGADHVAEAVTDAPVDDPSTETAPDSPSRPSRRIWTVAIAIAVTVAVTLSIWLVVTDNIARDEARESALALVADYDQAAQRFETTVTGASDLREQANAYIERIADPSVAAVEGRGDSLGDEAVAALTAARDALAERATTDVERAQDDAARFSDDAVVDELAATLHRGTDEERAAAREDVEAAIARFDAASSRFTSHGETLREGVLAVDQAIVDVAAVARDRATETLDAKPDAPGELREPLDAHRGTLAELADTPLPIDRFAGADEAFAALTGFSVVLPAYHDARQAVASWEPPPPPPPADSGMNNGGGGGGGGGRQPRSCVRYQWPYGMVVGTC